MFLFSSNSKEPLSPRPSIQITTDKFIIFLDYEIITETSSIDQAFAIIISLYVIFELQFGTHNRIIHLLYGILLQEPGALTKSLRLLLNQWNFIIDKKENKTVAPMVTMTPVTDDIQTVLAENQTQGGHSQAVYLPDNEKENHSTEKTGELHLMNKEQNNLFLLTLLDINQNPLTTITYIDDMTPMKDSSIETSGSSNSSSPVDRPLIIHTSPLDEQQPILSAGQQQIPSEEQQLTLLEEQQPTSSEKQHQTLSASPLMSDSITRAVNIKQKMASKTTKKSSTAPKKNISSTRKRPASPEAPITSRVTRSRVKKTK